MEEETQKTRRRRLVPDLNHTIEVKGQQLTRVAREPAPAAEEPAPASASPAEPPTLDTIARKHLGARAEALLEEHGEFLAALAEPEEASGSPIDMAGRLELFSDTIALPSAETNPDKRQEGSVSPLQPTDEAPDFLVGHSQPETLLDLFSMFPQLDGVNWFIYVERKLPRIHSGLKCDGVLRPISRPLSLNDWADIYGGGEYKLIVYGPPKRGTVTNADGRVSPKKMTAPIIVRFPGPPSFEGMYDDEDPMSQPSEFPVREPRRGPNTMADANIAVRQIDANADREKRLESQAERDRNEKEKLLREKASGDSALLSQLLQSQNALRDQMIEREREVAEERRADAEKWEKRLETLQAAAQRPDDVTRFVSIAKSMNTDSGSLDALRAEHAREVERMSDLRTRAEQHQQLQLKDERDRADRLIADERARAESRIRDAEERFHNAERELRTRTDSEVQRAKDEAERRLSDMDRMHNNRIADLERNHARDLAAKDSQTAMQLQTVESTHSMRLEAAKSEVKRTQSDVERYRAEAEENKDVVSKIKKLKEDAEELGMVDAASAGGDSEPETVPQMLMKVGGNLLSNLPNMLEHFSTLARGKNQQELEQARLLGQREQMIAESQGALPGSHPRRGGAPRQLPPALTPIASVQHAPLVPGPPRRVPRTDGAPTVPTADMQPEEIMRLEEEARRAGVAPAPQIEAAPASMAPPPNQMEPIPSGPPEALAPPAPDPALTQQYREDLDIVQSESHLLPPYQNGVSPTIMAAEFARLYPVDVIRGLLAQLGSADRVIAAYQRTQGADHPFVRRDGKKFLRGLFEELAKVAS